MFAQNATLFLVSELDFESPNKTYVFYVYAIDTGNRTGRALVTVLVIDFNDNEPRFEGKVYYDLFILAALSK